MERKRGSMKVIWNVAWTLQLYLLPSLIFRECQAMRDIDGTARSAMGALQRDMKMLGDITICTGLKRYIACIEGSNLAITKAFWGRISDKVCPSDDGDPVTDCDGSEDTLPLVKGYCEGKRECKLEARHTLLQKNGTHHCPGVNKYLVVNYTCIPESKSVTLCDSAETTLMCEAGWVIDVADVFWGRRSHAKYCGAEEGMECDSSDSASKYIRSACDGHRRCPVRADPNLLDNSHSPCTTILKYLMINYVCKPPEKDPISNEMLGLLESHYAQQDNKPQQTTGLSDQVPKETRTAPAVDERKYSPVQQPVSAPAYTSRKGKKAYFTASTNSEETDELSKALLGGVGLPVEVGTEHSAKKQDVPEDKGDESTKDGLRRAHAQRKTEVTKKGKDEAVASKRDKEESPLPLEKESEIKKEKSEQVMGTKRDKQADVKDSKKGKDPFADEGYYDDEFSKLTSKSKDKDDFSLKPSEPSTVRSILARAKEVLQTLGNDNSKFQAVIEKRENIAAAKNESDTEGDTTNSDLAILTKSDLVHDLSKDKTATPVIRDIIQQTAAAFSSKTPKQVKKASLPESRPEIMLGFGNTP